MNINPEHSKQLQEWQLKYTKVGPLLMILMGLLLIAFGIVSQTVDTNYEYISTQYDQTCSGLNTCQIAINIPSKMKAPVFFSYEISSFFQNTDKYFNSIPYKQLYGDDDFDSSICGQYTTNQEMNKTLSYQGTPLNPNDVAIPCGIAAYSYMSDTYIFMQKGNTTAITLSSKGISWETDRKRFKNTSPQDQWIDITDERFINWMRPSPLSRFRKLWGRIEHDLEAGDYIVQITINTNNAYTDSKKYILIHNNGQFSDPILVITLPCLCVGVVLVIFGFMNLIYWGKKRVLIKKYRIY